MLSYVSGTDEKCDIGSMTFSAATCDNDVDDDEIIETIEIDDVIEKKDTNNVNDKENDVTNRNNKNRNIVMENDKGKVANEDESKHAKKDNSNTKNSKTSKFIDQMSYHIDEQLLKKQQESLENLLFFENDCKEKFIIHQKKYISALNSVIKSHERISFVFGALIFVLIAILYRQYSTSN